MTFNDTINGLLEISGGLLNLFNIKRLLIDKQVKGISWPVVGFFTSWGLWNLFYYPSLGQYASTIGAVTLVVTNIIWLGLVLKYRSTKTCCIAHHHCR